MAKQRQREQHAMTEVRRQTFLKVLSETGSATAAAAAATPWSKSVMGGLQSFTDERKRNPEFAVAWQRAEEAALAKVETAIFQRAMNPTRRPVFVKGELKGYTDEYDNRLLVQLARRLNPSAWSERQQVEHTGKVEHEHRHGHIVATLDARDVLLLPPEEREQFLLLIEKIQTAKMESNDEQQPKQLPATSAG